MTLQDLRQNLRRLLELQLPGTAPEEWQRHGPDPEVACPTQDVAQRPAKAFPRHRLVTGLEHDVDQVVGSGVPARGEEGRSRGELALALEPGGHLRPGLQPQRPVPRRDRGTVGADGVDQGLGSRLHEAASKEADHSWSSLATRYITAASAGWPFLS